MRAETSSLMGKRSNRVFGWVVSALIVLFAWVFIARPYQLFADDTYFYLQVAWNFARGMGSTFNTIMPTNGYHPLWMLLCAGVYKLVPSKTGGLHGIAVLVSALDILMLVTVRLVVRRTAGDLWVLAFAVLIPFCFLTQLGTEGALSGLFLALVMLHAYQMSEAPAVRTAVLFNLEAALAVLSRLDNIFIVGFVWLAVWMSFSGTDGSGRDGSSGDGSSKDGRRARRLQLLTLPIYVILWGSYVGSNWIFFHTIQPISGMLKSNSAVTHALRSHLPHTALLMLAIILICLPVVALGRRDRFFRVVEVPFFLGVLSHGAYILLRMSSETRWTWYYTSWALLAAVLLARAGSVVLQSGNRERRKTLAVPISALLVFLLAVAWVKLSYQRSYRGVDVRPSAAFNQMVFRQAGIRSAFVYDEPGMLAYYSEMKLVPLDGLMGDVQFQHDLGAVGIRALAARDHIDAFIGPATPFDEEAEKNYCDQMFLSSVELHCAPDGPGRWQVTSADVYSRVPFAPAGRLQLDSSQIVWREKDLVTVWRIVAAP